MTPAVSPPLLARFSEFVAARFGLHFPHQRRRDLERRIFPAARDFGFKDADAFVEWLISSQLTKEQLETLVCHLTVGETYFFREQKGFEALEAHILPALLAARRGKDQRLRIWCAGCSTGEEPYSVAILLHRLIADLPQWNVTILATDINPVSLRKGRQGVYGDWSFRGTPRWLKEKYFTVNGEGRFVIAGAIRNMVTFAPLNLAEDTYPSLLNNTNAMDVIFCRNVLMYLAPDRAKRVTEKFHHSLVDDGWLLVSPCETSSTLFPGFASVLFNDAVFYRKEGERQGDAAPRHATIGGQQIPVPSFTPVAPAIPPDHPAPAALPGTSFPAPEGEGASPPSALSSYEKALLLYREGKYAEAAATLADAFADNPPGSVHLPFGEAATLLTHAYANQGDFTAALKWTEKAVAVDRLNPQPYYLQATIFQEQGAIEAAIVSLKKAIYLDQGFVLAHFALANLSFRRGKRKEAARHLENAATLLHGYGDDDLLPGSEGMSARRLADIIAATRSSIN